MPRPKNPDTKPLLLAGEKAVNFSVRLPLDLALRIEDYLHQQMRRNMVETGSRAEASVASLFRGAIEHYLECPKATPVEVVRRGRPRKDAEVTPKTAKASSGSTRKKG
jgi:hypothetical protein